MGKLCCLPEVYRQQVMYLFRFISLVCTDRLLTSENYKKILQHRLTLAAPLLDRVVERPVVKERRVLMRGERIKGEGYM